jgi:hypothetical protein
LSMWFLFGQGTLIRWTWLAVTNALAYLLQF